LDHARIDSTRTTISAPSNPTSAPRVRIPNTPAAFAVARPGLMIVATVVPIHRKSAA